MPDGFHSTPADLATHSGTMSKLGGRLDAAAKKGAGVDLGIETYGIIGQAFSSSAREQISQTAEAMTGVATAFSDFGTDVKAAGEHYEKIEDEIKQLLKSLHTEE